MKIPLSLSVYEHAAALIGRTPWEVSRSGELLWQAHREACRLYRHFPVTIGLDIYNVEAEAYGCTVSHPVGHGIPAIASPLLARLEDGQRLQPPGADSGRFPLLIEAGRRIKAEFPEADVRIPISGPFSVAQNLLGAEVLLTEVATRPHDVRRFLLHLVEGQVRFAQAVAAAGLGVALFESAAAPPLLSPRQFREVELPALKEAIGRVSAVVGRRLPCIIGGDTAPIVPEIMETGTDFVICPAETDRQAFLRRMDAYPEVKVRVNLKPSVYSQGTLADIAAAVDTIVGVASGRPNVLLHRRHTLRDTSRESALPDRLRWLNPPGRSPPVPAPTGNLLRQEHCMTVASAPDRPLKVVMIGAGGMATRVHYPSLASFADVSIVAACDLDAQRLNAVADQFGIEGRYGDYRRMIEETAPDAVYAIGQPHYMYDVWVWCLEHGLDLCIEKPLGLTLHQARILAYLADRHGCITQVSFQRRAAPLLALLREECLRRGPMTHAVCQFYKCQPEPLTAARDHMMDDGVHAIDTLRWACGGDVIHIESLTRCVLVPDVNFFAVLLQFSSGASGVMLNSWTSGRRIFRVEMHAPRVCAEADPEGEGRLYADGDTAGVAYDARTVAGGDDFYVYGGFRAKNRQFIDAVRAGHQPESSFADALKTMEVAERILAQGLLAPTS